MLSNDEAAIKTGVVALAWKRLGQLYQKTLDDCTPHVAGRWIFAGLLVLSFLCRVFIAQVTSLTILKCLHAECVMYIKIFFTNKNVF